MPSRYAPDVTLPAAPAGGASRGAAGAFGALGDAIKMYLTLRQQQVENARQQQQVDQTGAYQTGELKHSADMLQEEKDRGDETAAQYLAQNYPGKAFDPQAPGDADTLALLKRGKMGGALQPETIPLAPVAPHTLGQPQTGPQYYTPTPTGREQLTTSEPASVRAAALRNQASIYNGDANRQTATNNNAARIAASGLERAAALRETTTFHQMELGLRNKGLNLQAEALGLLFDKANASDDIETYKLKLARLAEIAKSNPLAAFQALTSGTSTPVPEPPSIPYFTAPSASPFSATPIPGSGQ